MKKYTSFLKINIAAFIFLFFSCNTPTENKNNDKIKTSLAVINARIWTGNAQQPWAEAMLINDDTISFVGSTSECQKLTDASTKIVDAKQQMITPGFIDAHVHFVDAGFGLTSVQLRDVNTKEEFIRRIGAYAKTIPNGTWIMNGDWDQTLWGGEMPSAIWIDSVTPNNPVFINRLDGHLALANSSAMKLAGLTSATKDVYGGEISRDLKNNPTGIFKDNAKGLIRKVVPDAPEILKDNALQAAMNFVASKGVTSVHHMGHNFDDLETFRRARAQNKIITRIYAVTPLANWAQLRDEIAKNGKGDKWLHIGGLKGYVDGSLGAHTAAMLQPFSDAKGGTGFFITPPDSLYVYTSNADKNNLQVMVHAIGDKAIRTQLDIYERVEKENGTRDRRFRIEHAQHISPQDLPRFAALDVTPSMQPYHCIDDGRWAEKIIGHERAKTTYAFRSLINSGVRPAFGSDWYVAPPTPLEGIYAAVTRRTLDDKNPDGWIPEQKITVEEALRCYTINAAHAGFEEKYKGSLEKGKVADFVILEKDLTKIAPETIKDVKIIATYVGGKRVFENK